jgi:hypothetical protein
VAAGDTELRRPQTTADQTENSGAEHNRRERNLEEINSDESEGRDPPHDFVAQRFLSDAKDGSEDNCGYRRL